MTKFNNSVLNGVFWSYLDQFGLYFIKFAFSIYIARILSPSDYGIVGMIAIFIAVSTFLSEGGFLAALVQKQNVTQTDYSTVFWFNLGTSFLLFLILCSTSSLISGFYNQPILKYIIPAASFNILLNSLGVIQTVHIWKEINFRKFSFINFTSFLASGIVGVILAKKNYGVWSLVIMTLIGSFVRTGLLWLSTKKRPSFRFSKESFVSLFRYGNKILVQNLNDLIFTNIFYVLIGKKYSAGQLGFYSNADRFRDIFIRQTTVAYTKVSFPAFSAIQDQREKFINSYIKTYRVLSYIMFPFIIILIMIIHPFVLFFLTEKWLPAVPLMYLFFMEGFYYYFTMLNQNTFNALGKSGLALKIDFLKYSLITISIFITFNMNIKFLIVGQITSTFIIFILNTIIVCKVLKISLRRIIFDIVPIIFITLICFSFNYFIITDHINNLLLLIIIPGISTIILYLLLSLILKPKPFIEFVSMIEKYLPLSIRAYILKYI
jgi:O-antigen/teichoic acid export membrane protein